MTHTLRRIPLLITAAAAALSLAGLAHAEPAPAAATDPSLEGTVGVCVRWGSDQNRLADVVVVEPSGNSLLDATIPSTLRGMDWPRPSGYGGEWVALSVGVAGAEPTGKLPNCDALAEEAAGPARPLATGKTLAV